MPFPTTAQLTDFSGGVENPISEGGTWASTSGFFTGSGDAQRDGSGGMDGGGSNYEMKRTETTGPNCEVWCTFSSVAAAFKVLAMKLNGSDFYKLDISSGNVWRFYKTGDVQIGADLATQALSNGDAIGFEYVGGTTLRAYRKPSGGSWGQVGTDRTDSDLASTTGVLAIAAEASHVVDDFGGGTVITAAALVGSGFSIYSRWNKG